MGSRGLSMAAFQMQAVAVGWQVYAMTGSALDLGLVGLAQFLPMLLCALPAGHVADRFDRKIVGAACLCIEGLCAFLLAVGTLGGWLDRNLILLILAVSGGTRAFELPTMQALLPATVSAHWMPRAIAFASSANQTAAICGPAIGGLLYALGVSVPYWVAGCFFVLAGYLAHGLVLKRPPPRRPPAGLAGVFSGLAFIWKQKPIFGSISLDMVAVLFGGATALLPIFARDILHVGAAGMGVLRAAPAIGALCTTMVLTRAPPTRRLGRLMFSAVFIYGLCMVLFGLSSSMWLSMLALACSGAADSISVFIRSSLVQTRTPEHMLGRVAAVNALFVGTSAQIGEFESGVTAALMGAVGSVLLGGAGTLVVCLAWIGLFPGLRRLDRVAEEV